MSDIAIKFENISKQYRLGEIGTGTLSHDLNRWWHKVRRMEDPYLKVGSVNVRSEKSDTDYVWALRDINLEVRQGEVLGIIGKNGAGKSTLLKILSKVTRPTTGIIKTKGRIASLLEVGTGFHPEMTGKENVYMNGSIMGMTKAEITRKFDEIVDFAGVGRYIDTPVKRYSSGMTVRLGFAIAAHLEPEILVVDEVLAVGDAEFQKKAVGKMQDVSHEKGRTVLFVSHNMTAIKALCQKAVLLQNSVLNFKGDVGETVNRYLSNNLTSSYSRNWDNGENAHGNEYINIKELSLKPIIGNILNIDSGFTILLRFLNKTPNINLDVTFDLFTSDEVHVFHNGCIICDKKNSKIGHYQVTGTIPPKLLNNGHYRMNIIFGQDQRYVLFKLQDAISFEIDNSSTGKGSNFSKLPGILWMDFNWQTMSIDF